MNQCTTIWRLVFTGHWDFCQSLRHQYYFWGALVALSTSNEVQQAHPGGCSLSLSDFIPAFIPTVPLLYPINLPSPPVQAEAQRIHHEKWHNNAEMGYQHTPAENESVKQQGKQQLFKRSKDLTPTKRK